MASSGFLSSKTPGTPTCHCTKAYLRGSSAIQSCFQKAWPAEVLHRHVAFTACSGNHQQYCTQAAALNSSRRADLPHSSSPHPTAVNNSSSSNNNSGFSCAVQAQNTVQAAGRSAVSSSSRHGKAGSSKNAGPGKQRLSGADIMRQLKAATSWQQLQQLVQQHGSRLNQRHSSALITHLAQITATQQQQIQQIEQHATCHVQEQEEQQQLEQPGLEFEPLIDLQAAAAAAAAAGAQLSPNAGSSSSRVRAVTVAIDPGLQQFILKAVAPLIDAHLQQYDARGLANTVWALARLQPVLQTSGGPTAAAATVYPARRWLELFCSVSQQLLKQCDAQQLSNTLWALVNLQHQPPESWLCEWYAAFAQHAGFGGPHAADRGSRGAVQLQSLSSALWSVAQLQSRDGSSSSGCLWPPEGWVGGLLHRSVGLLQHTAHHNSSQDSSDGQAISNLLWSCAQLQQQPPSALLQVVQQRAEAATAAGSIQQGRQLLSDQAVSNLMWSLARFSSQLQEQQWEQNPNSTAAGAAAAEVDDPQEQRRHSSRHCSTSGRDGNSSSSSRAGSTHSIISSVTCSSSSGKAVVVLRCCGAALLAAVTGRVRVMNWRHVATVAWAAGVLQLHLSSEWVFELQQRLQQQEAISIQDQELALLLWGLSRLQIHQPQQQQMQLSSNSSKGRQQQLAPPPAAPVGVDHGVLQQLLQAHQAKLPGYSSLALHSILLSLGRLGFGPSEALLQAWLKEVAGRNFLAAAGGQAMADVCCALAYLRRHQTAGKASSNSSRGFSTSTTSSWGSGFTVSSQLGFQQCKDADWLAGFCTVSAARLGACTVGELSAIGWALAALGFKPPAAWVLTWHLAVADAAAAAVLAGRLSATAAAAARAMWALKQLPSASGGASKTTTTTVRLLEAITAATAAGMCDPQTLAVAADSAADVYRSSREQQQDSNSKHGLQASMQQLMQHVVPILHSCTSQQLLMLLTAAASTGVQPPDGFLLAAVQHAQMLAQQQQLSNRCIAGMLEAVAKLQAHVVSVTGHDYAAATAASVSLPQQKQLQQHHCAANRQHQELTRPQLRQWIITMLRAFSAESALPDELTMVLWSLAVLEYHPGLAWLNKLWLQHSQQQLPRFTASQLASAGWALTVLNHKPFKSWSRAWTEAARSQTAAASPGQLSLLLYAAVTLDCHVDKSWLLGAAVAAANSIRRWSARDLSLGLWGLAQLGLRAVADVELLEALWSQLSAQQTVAAMPELSPHQLLQMLQAVVLLRPPAAPVSAAAAVVGLDDHWVRGNPLLGRRISGNMLRRLRWRARTTARQADAAAAAALAATRHHQQLLAIQSTTSSSGQELAVAAVTAQEAAAAWRTAVTAAAAAGATLVSASNGRSPDAAGMPVEPAWVLSWCQAASRQMHRWSPSVAAAALSAIAALGVQPPLAWQQQLLRQVLRKRKHMTAQYIRTVSSGLDLLRSPLKQQWMQEVQVIDSAVAAATAGAVGSQEQSDQRQQQLTNAKRKQLWQQQWLKQRQKQKVSLRHTYSSRGSTQSVPASTHEGIRYPQKLTSHALLHIRRQHRTVRLVSWWRRQQQLLHQQRQERLLHQQQRRGAAAVPGTGLRADSRHKRKPAALNGSSSKWAIGSRTSRSNSFSYTPVSSLDIVGVVSHSSSSNSAPGGVAPGVGLPSRKLGSSSSQRCGLELAQKPVLRQAQPAAASAGSALVDVQSCSSGRPEAQTGGVEISGEIDSTASTAQAAAAAAAAAAPVAPSNGSAAAAVSSHPGVSLQRPVGSVNGNSSRVNGVTSSAADEVAADAVVVDTDVGVVQAVWESLSVGTAAEKGSNPIELGGARGRPTLTSGGVVPLCERGVGQLQRRQLSWACQIN